MSQIWNLLLYQPILNLLILLYNLFFSNLGLAIIIMTVLIRLVLIPLTNPQLKSAKKMQELGPELEKLKKKFKDDKKKLMQAQMELYKKNGVNPASGCLPQIVQMIILITLYQAFNQVVKPDGVEVINKALYSFVPKFSSDLNFNFLNFMNLSKPDLIKIPGFFNLPGVFVILATVFQFLSSKLMAPVVKKEEVLAEKTEKKTDDMTSAMQKQMLYMFPLMTLFFGYTMPLGVMLYWFTFSLSSYIQQVLINKKEAEVKNAGKRSGTN